MSVHRFQAKLLKKLDGDGPCMVQFQMPDQTVATHPILAEVLQVMEVGKFYDVEIGEGVEIVITPLEPLIR